MKVLVLALLILFTPLAFAYDSEPRTDYETVAAGQTLQRCGPTGLQGDVIDKLIIIPGVAAAGAVSISDDANISIFVGGGTTALPDLKPIIVPMGTRARSSTGWKVTTGSNVTAICVGRFQ